MHKGKAVLFVGILLVASMGMAADEKPAVPVTDYHVGAGQRYANIVSVPWEALNPGDTVYIHWRSPADGGDYHEKVNLTRAGVKGNCIHIIGVKGPGGERPCLNGTDALTRTTDPEGNSTHFPGQSAAWGSVFLQPCPHTG